MALKLHEQTQPICTVSFSFNDHVPSVYRPAIHLLNPNASLYIFHVIFHLDALPRERKGPLPVSIAPLSKGEGLSERKDCIRSVVYWIIYSVLSDPVSSVVVPGDLIIILWVLTLLILPPVPGWWTPYGSRRKTENPWMHPSTGLFNHCQVVIGKFESTGVFPCFVLRACYQPGFNCNRIYGHCPQEGIDRSLSLSSSLATEGSQRRGRDERDRV